MLLQVLNDNFFKTESDLYKVFATSVEEEGEWDRLIFAETTGTVTRDREKMVIS